MALTLLMAIGATLLALPGGIALAGWPGATAGWCGVCCFCGRNYPRHPADICHLLAVVSAADATGGDLPGAVTVTGAGVVYRRLGDALGAGRAVAAERTV